MPRMKSSGRFSTFSTLSSSFVSTGALTAGSSCCVSSTGWGVCSALGSVLCSALSPQAVSSSAARSSRAIQVLLFMFSLLYGSFSKCSATRSAAPSPSPRWREATLKNR